MYIREAWLIERINIVNAEGNIEGFIDDQMAIDTKIGDTKIVGTTDALLEVDENVNAVCAIGSAKVRKKVINKLSVNKKLIFPNIIDSSLIGLNDIKMGKGNIFTVNINMSDFNIINLLCTVGHDVKIGNFNTMYSGVNVSGCVNIGNCVELGTGSKIIQGKKI